MQTPNQREHETLTNDYREGVIANYERLTASPSERVRLESLQRLAPTVGIARLIPQLFKLAQQAESDRIALKANNMIADYLGICPPVAADGRSEPLRFSLEPLKPKQIGPPPPGFWRNHPDEL